MEDAPTLRDLLPHYQRHLAAMHGAPRICHPSGSKWRQPPPRAGDARSLPNFHHAGLCPSHHSRPEKGPPEDPPAGKMNHWPNGSTEFTGLLAQDSYAKSIGAQRVKLAFSEESFRAENASVPSAGSGRMSVGRHGSSRPDAGKASSRASAAGRNIWT